MKKLERLTLKELVNAAIIIEDQRSIVGGSGNATLSDSWTNSNAGGGMDLHHLLTVVQGLQSSLGATVLGATVQLSIISFMVLSSQKVRVMM